MAKKIIILDRVGEPSDVAYRVAFWLTIPSTRWAFYAKPAGMNPDGTPSLFKSQYKDATDAENQDLRDGKVMEVIETYYKPAGSTIAQIMTFLQGEYIEKQAFFDSINPYNRYGSYWDGTSWIAGGVS
jgi:hypothetical protein